MADHLQSIFSIHVSQVSDNILVMGLATISYTVDWVVADRSTLESRFVVSISLPPAVTNFVNMIGRTQVIPTRLLEIDSRTTLALT